MSDEESRSLLSIYLLSLLRSSGPGSDRPRHHGWPVWWAQMTLALHLLLLLLLFNCVIHLSNFFVVYILKTELFFIILNGVLANDHVLAIERTVSRGILVDGVGLVNASIVNILLAQSAHWWGLDVALVQLQGQRVGRNDGAVVSRVTVVVDSLLKLRTINFILLVYKLLMPVDLLNSDRNLPSVGPRLQRVPLGVAVDDLVLRISALGPETTNTLDESL